MRGRRSAGGTRRAGPRTRARRNPELTATLNDIRAMALLGKYYAAKIRGATELAFFRATRRGAHQQAAVEHLTRAAAFWKDYSAPHERAVSQSVMDQPRRPGRLPRTRRCGALRRRNCAAADRD